MSFQDSELSDEHGIHILNMIKFSANKRDTDQFELGLRKAQCFHVDSSDHDKGPKGHSHTSPAKNTEYQNNEELIDILISSNAKTRESSPEIKKKLAEQKETILNQVKGNNLRYRDGLRMVDLRRNNLGSIFMKCFQNCMRFDSYLNCMDLSHNQITQDSLLDFLGSNSLTANTSFISLDISYNPGCNDKIKK